MTDKFTGEGWQFSPSEGEQESVGSTGGLPERATERESRLNEAIRPWLESAWYHLKGDQYEEQVDASLRFIEQHSDTPRFLDGIGHLAEAQTQLNFGETINALEEIRDALADGIAVVKLGQLAQLPDTPYLWGSRLGRQTAAVESAQDRASQILRGLVGQLPIRQPVETRTQGKREVHWVRMVQPPLRKVA